MLCARKGGIRMGLFHWLLLIGIYGIMLVLILAFLRGANPWQEDEDPIIREDEYGRRV
jgi:hypothetical protein